MKDTFSINAKEFEQFFKNEHGSPTRFLMATLTKADQNLLGVNSSNLWLLQVSLQDHLEKHPEIGMSDYLKIPEIVRNADVWGGHKERRFLFINLGGGLTVRQSKSRQIIRRLGSCRLL